MNIKKYLGLATLALPLSAVAQVSINFETEGEYKKISVYDSWEESPFRTGKLTGNVAVAKNTFNTPDEAGGEAINPTANCLGFQRSRFASNMFGARIDLNEPMAAGPTTKYIHVMLNKPVEGRVMLVALGKRPERADQRNDVEQAWLISTTKIVPNKWNDCVFGLKTADGVEIHSFVIMPDLEAPHTLTQDFACYIDDIVVNNDSKPRVVYGDYVLNFDESQASDKSGNYLKSIALNGSKDGNQTIAVGSVSPQVIYRDLTNKLFTAKAGERLTPNFNFSASWMNGYVYLDRGHDGKFTADLTDKYTIPEGSDIMSYSYVETVENQEGYKSDGTKISGNNRNFINPPAFTLPSDLTPGYYRMRFKVDWGNVDPAGRMTTTNSIVSNGGQIVDVLMNIHTDEVNISRSGGLNGDIALEDGTDLVTKTVPFGSDFTIVSKPAPDFELDYVTIKHGYNLNSDSLVHSTPQWFIEKVPASKFKDGKYTIPGKYIDGEVIITPQFVNPGLRPDESYPEDDEADYVTNFDKKSLAITRSDRKLNSFTLSSPARGSSSVTIPAAETNLVYRRLVESEVNALAGEPITTDINYTGNAMHSYLFIDWDEDGAFNNKLNADGTPAEGGELVTYSYYNDKNSTGAAVSPTEAQWYAPAFTIPAGTKPGMYRARLKIDWANIDPAGQWAENGENKINDNGGYVVDFLLNVQKSSPTLSVETTNGSINGANNTGLPMVTPLGSELTIVPTPAAEGYTAESVIVRHGERLDGPQFIHGNRQWRTLNADGADQTTLSAERMNGDVLIKADFVAGENAAYKLVFSDEFNGEDASQPEATKWVRSGRFSSTWNRWISKTEAQHKKTGYIEDGKFVARAVPNDDKASDNVDMITGAIKSMGKFGFKYGKVEGRIKTNMHRGNFPAFWMMPEDQSDGWPYCGEIDIWEQINVSNIAYHTVHTNWTYTLGNRTGSSFNETVLMDRYHTYGLEWDENSISWYVDGKKVGEYKKSTKTSELDKGQWPFNKNFHIILNQSVGDGSWAQNADITHTYETRFDWVRVYQKEGQTNTGIEDIQTVASGVEFFVAPGKLHIVSPAEQMVHVVDLQGRMIYQAKLQGSKVIALPQGVYLLNGRKVMVP